MLRKLSLVGALDMTHKLLTLFAAIAMAWPQSAVAMRHNGWWVIVATYPSTPESRQSGDVREVERKAAPCGINPFNDLSTKFRGFAPGYNVFVLGAYANQAQATTKAAAVRKCFPDAYVKQGDYMGE